MIRKRPARWWNNSFDAIPFPAPLGARFGGFLCIFISATAAADDVIFYAAALLGRSSNIPTSDGACFGHESRR